MCLKQMRILVLALGMFIASPSWAVFEARGHGGFGVSDSSHFNRFLNSYGLPGLYVNGSYGYDLLLTGGPLAAGVRYDFTGIKIANGNDSAVIGSYRWAGVLGIRFPVGATTRLGVIGTYGWWHDSRVGLKVGSSNILFEKASTRSLTGGIEAGVLFGPLLGALEVGYQTYELRDVEGSSGKPGMDVLFNGLYTKLLVGVSL